VSEDTEYQYTAASARMDMSMVRTRAEELMEAKMEKLRFGLPFAPAEKRLGLRSVFGGDEEDSFDDWQMDHNVEDLND
jgi:hypothetical protein